MFQPELEALERDALIALQLERARTSLERVLRQPAWAKRLGHNEAARILEQNLNEEKAADKKLTTIAESKVNLKAAS